MSPQNNERAFRKNVKKFNSRFLLIFLDFSLTLAVRNGAHVRVKHAQDTGDLNRLCYSNTRF